MNSGSSDAGKLHIFRDEYVQKLDTDPQDALREVGIEPTPEMLSALAKLNKSDLMELMAAFTPPPGGPAAGGELFPFPPYIGFP